MKCIVMVHSNLKPTSEVQGIMGSRWTVESFNGKQCMWCRPERRRCCGTFNRLLRTAAPPIGCIEGLDWDGSPSSAVHPSVPPYMVHCMHIRRGQWSLWSSRSLFLSHLQVISPSLSLHFVADFNLELRGRRRPDQRNGTACNDQCVRQKGYFSLNLRVDKGIFCPTHFGAS
jgi:hypothetical protein